MRVGFAGTPEFAARVLTAIADAGHTIPLCVTQPDRPKGRGLRHAASPVKAVAEGRAIPVVEPVTLKTAEARSPLVAVPLDVLVVAAYGLLLPPSVLDWPRYGCLNVHASLLPRWRGAAPIERAIEAGDTKTGITIMQMDAGLDTGAIVAATEVRIDLRETAGSLTSKLAAAGSKTIIETLARLAREGALQKIPQSSEGVSYARKIDDLEAAIAWQLPAGAIERKIRAFDPSPGAHTWLDEDRVKLWSANVIEQRSHAAPPGTVVASGGEGIDVACGEGILRVLELQPAGRRRMASAAFLAGRSLPIGSRLSPPAERA
jgi:methionyl-tRNA formyltransferase